jgi:hypothetical protein
MVFFGILGEYAGRTYLRVNNKPQAAIRKILSAGPGGVPKKEGRTRENQPGLQKLPAV